MWPPAAELPALQQSVHTSIAPDFLICLEGCRRFKSLKRLLRMAYGMTPEDWRVEWGPRPDCPMVAPNYAKNR